MSNTTFTHSSVHPDTVLREARQETDKAVKDAETRLNTRIDRLEARLKWYCGGIVVAIAGLYGVVLSL